jgi:hypothetical protein
MRGAAAAVRLPPAIEEEGRRRRTNAAVLGRVEETQVYA